jgi:hypothetical protein
MGKCYSCILILCQLFWGVFLMVARGVAINFYGGWLPTLTRWSLHLAELGLACSLVVIGLILWIGIQYQRDISRERCPCLAALIWLLSFEVVVSGILCITLPYGLAAVLVGFAPG